MFNQSQEFFSSLLLRSEAAQHARCDSESTWFLNAPHGHTHMSCLHDHSDTARFYSFLDCNGDLFCETFLNLETTTESFSYACKFGQSQDKLIGDVTDGNLKKIGVNIYLQGPRTSQNYLSGKWYEMMFAQT